MSIIVNGAPHYVDLGTKDSSGRQVARAPKQYPQHLPKWYIFAERGPEEDWYGAGVDRENQYGTKTFDARSEYFTHQTRGSNVVNALGNVSCYHRVVPKDAGPASNATLWLELLPSTVDDYERNKDGSLKVDAGVPIIKGQIPGFKYKLVVTHDTDHGAAESFARKTTKQGTMFDPANPSVRSTMYPILGTRVSSRGKWGNNIGYALWPLDGRGDVLPEKVIKANRCFPFGFKMFERDLNIGSVTTLRTALNDESILLTLKPMSFDPSTEQDMYFASRYNESYFQTDTRYPLVEPAINQLVIYQDSIDAVLKALYEAERPYIDANFHDFSSTTVDEEVEKEKYLFNFLTGRTLNGYLYHSFVPEMGSVSMDRNQITYLAGGTDGTMSLDVLEKAMIEDVRRYRDANDEYQDKAFKIENHMYDTGWTLNGKYEMMSLIALRGDTFVTLGTFQEGERAYDNSEELSISSALKARLSNLPESTYFGTSVVRAGIYNTSAKLRGDISGKRVSTVLEVAHKRAKCMGKANGAWDIKYRYDEGAPGSVAEVLSDFGKLWVPVSVRYRFWDAGLNWWGRLDREQSFCPAFRTVYSDDTSILTADTVAQALIFLNRVNDRSWRYHTGTTGVPAPVFLTRIKNFILGQVNGKLDPKFGVEPVPVITAADKLRGFSWHSGINLFADPMRTVAVNYTEAFRQEDRGNVKPTFENA